MSRFELRWAIHHPLRWLAVWWLHLAVAAALTGIAVAWTADIFARVLQPNLWPIGMGAVAMAVLASALAPFEARLQAVCGSALITMGALRAFAMLEVWWQGDTSGPLLAVLALHSLILAACGVVWPDWTLACGTRATVEAGREGMSG